ncbi:hypothetical protein FV218_05720 [Methylobacterium sp. WL69]|uniref:hypothetical protein n=1 Tax=Methylobacterium sp. WL69 TaxID=2603893 RepID=UPI0011CA5C50|nr:hypothetical protein [Methylobacterium sp. WL69]TXM77102.1 hypothetical protein FV218_05720 [Methylobacterium sp. WL69]
MTAIPIFGRDWVRARPTAPWNRRDRDGGQALAFVATLVLAAVTGLPLASVANLMPQADDPADSFRGL